MVAGIAVDVRRGRARPPAVHALRHEVAEQEAAGIGDPDGAFGELKPATALDFLAGRDQGRQTFVGFDPHSLLLTLSSRRFQRPAGAPS